MNRSSTFSMGGLLLGTPANQAIVPQMKPLDKNGELYLGPFEDFTIGRDISCEETKQSEAVWQELRAELAALSSNGQQVIAEKSGHLVHVDEPERSPDKGVKVWYT
jgi:hypothetical protein